MFNNARSFNQDLSSWDVSKGINFVSGLGNEVLLLIIVGVVCIIMSLECWSVIVDVRVLFDADRMVAVLLTYAILLLSCL